MDVDLVLFAGPGLTLRFDMVAIALPLGPASGSHLDTRPPRLRAGPVSRREMTTSPTGEANPSPHGGHRLA